MTTEILEEYEEVAKRLNVHPSVAGRLVNLLREEVEEVTGKKVVEISPDPDDNCFVLALRKGRLTSWCSESEALPTRENYQRRSSLRLNSVGWFDAGLPKVNIGLLAVSGST